MKINISSTTALIAALVLFSAANVARSASTTIAYQGVLREQGVPVTADKSMVFRIFPSTTGGSAVWTSGAQSVSVENGLFRTLINPTGVDWESPAYFEVEVEGTPLAPRELLTASPYAVNSQYLQGKSYATAATAPASPSAGDIWFDTISKTLNVWSGTAWDLLSSSALSITDVNISTGAAIQLSKLEKDPSQVGTINTSTNPVDWSQLKNVPAAFADGVDNLGAGTPAVLENNVSVEPAAGAFNFSGPQFNVTSAPAGQANIFLDGSSVTLQGNAFNGINQLVELNGAGALPVLSGANLTSLTLANLSAGALPGNVIASSIAASSVQDAAIVALSASKLTGTGTLPNAVIDGSSVTLQGNVFNAAGKLVQLNGSTQLPAVSGANLTSLTPANFSAGALPANVIASSIAANAVQDTSVVAVSASKLTGTGTLPNATLNASSVTLQGNAFNGAGNLVRLDGSGNLTISGWTTILDHFSATANLDFGATGAGSCENQTITVTGAVTGDSVYLGLPATLGASDVWQVWTAYVSANDTVTVRRCNVDGRLAPAALSNPAAATVRVDVWRH